MTLRGMIRISALGAGLLLASALASSIAHAQTRGQPQVWVERHRDSVVAVTPQGRADVLFGLSRDVVAITGIPITTPARGYCVHAIYQEPVVAIDSVVTVTGPEIGSCPPQYVPLMIRPECKLTIEENERWRVKPERPVILFCDSPAKAFLFTRPEQ